MNQKIIFIKNKVVAKAPEILIGTGICGVVAGGVLGCRATLKVPSLMEEHRAQIDGIRAIYAEADEDEKRDEKKAVFDVYKSTAFSLTRLYGPAIAIEAASIFAICKGNNILKSRNLVLAGAYAALDEGFTNYRNNVKEEFGEDTDKRMLFGLKKEKVETITTDADGKEHKKKEEINVVDDCKYSEYARFFDESCNYYDPNDPDFNKMYLQDVERWANEKLRAQGHLFLNEVYDAIGIPRSNLGAVVGWLYVPDEYGGNPMHGDNYVSFGLYDAFGKSDEAEVKRRFHNGYEPVILLDFNVDGLIYDKI